ncbi:MAG: geranylgeranyl diphosphate reductase, partial [Chloroflexi bacterium]|nr:geranylgeranyl diphosphate reductase [Chloroflexota bacterium]
MHPVVVVGASVGGSITAETLAKAGIPVVMLEKDVSRIKPCGGAVPPVAFTEFAIPQSLISRKISKALIHSPSGRRVNIDVVGLDHSSDDYIAMVCREDFDGYLRKRAVHAGATLIEGALSDVQIDADGVDVHVRERASGQLQSIRASVIIGADGAY